MILTVVLACVVLVIVALYFSSRVDILEDKYASLLSATYDVAKTVRDTALKVRNAPGVNYSDEEMNDINYACSYLDRCKNWKEMIKDK